MPYLICPIHGGNIAPHVCRHVADKIALRQSPGPLTHVDLDGIFFMGWVCPNCLQTLNDHGLQTYLERFGQPKRLGESTDSPPEAEIDPLIEWLDVVPTCPKCFEELFNVDMLPTTV
jgi:hypothetical protein